MNETLVVVPQEQKPSRKRDMITLLSILTLIIAGLLMACVLIAGVQADSEVVIYPVVTLVLPLGTILFMTLCGLIPWMFLLVSFFTFENLVNPKDYPEGYYFELFSVLAAAVIFVVSFFRLFVIADLTYIDSTDYAGNTYMLAERHTFDDLGYGTYMFYECPNSKITCRRIYKDDGKYSIRMAGGAKAQILLRPELNALSIVIDGETILHIHDPMKNSWLKVAISLLLLSLFGLAHVAYTTRGASTEIIYPLYADPLGLAISSLFSSICFIPLAFMGILITIGVRILKQQGVKRSEILALVITVLAGGVVFYTARFFFDSNRPPRYTELSEHVASVNQAGRVYHLAARTQRFDSHRDYRYMLYECDGLGIHCSLLDFELLCNLAEKLRLVANPGTGNVSISLDSETIYRYSPQTKQGRIIATPPQTSIFGHTCQIQRVN